MEDVELHL